MARQHSKAISIISKDNIFLYLTYANTLSKNARWQESLTLVFVPNTSYYLNHFVDSFFSSSLFTIYPPKALVALASGPLS